MKMAVFWVVPPCILVELYRRLRGACCLHRHVSSTILHGTTNQRTAIFTFAAVRTANLTSAEHFNEVPILKRRRAENVVFKSPNTEFFIVLLIFRLLDNTVSSSDCSIKRQDD